MRLDVAMICSRGSSTVSVLRSSVITRPLPSLTAWNYRYMDRGHASLVSRPSDKLYRDTMLDNLEYVERYNEGGYHPVHLEDSLDGGRYHIVHKLGWGGSSTVWLARDEQIQRLVSLKILTARASKEDKESTMLGYLDRRPGQDPGRGNIISITDKFRVEGPNGTHTCHVSHLSGPSMGQLIQTAWQTAGSRQLRGSLARRLARQLAEAVQYLHSVGMVHGGS